MNWFYSNAVGGVKLQVKEADVKRAIEILHQKPISVDFVTDEAEKEDEGLYCPKCNSSDVYYEKFSRRLVFTSWLILGIPFLFFKKKWICQKCGYEWKV
jgi:transposase-like protein